MKTDQFHAEYEVHLGENIKHLMKALQIIQAELADKLDMPHSRFCNLLQKPDIDDDMLQRIADAMGHGVTVELIKNYNHDDTIQYIFNTYNNTIESGGTGTNANYEIKTQENENNYVAEQVFVYADKITQLEKQLLYHRMLTEPEEVKKEMQALKKGDRQEEK